MNEQSKVAWTRPVLNRLSAKAAQSGNVSCGESVSPRVGNHGNAYAPCPTPS